MHEWNKPTVGFFKLLKVADQNSCKCASHAQAG